MANKLTDAQFVDALSSNQGRMRAYAICIVGNPVDADDLVQNACLTLWEKREDYDSDRDFFPWASGFVMIQLLRHRRKKSTEKLVFDETLIETVSAEYIESFDELDRRRERLHYCLARLNVKDRDLLEARYCSKLMPKEISQLHGSPLPTVYGTLARIRGRLRRCIETSLVNNS